MIDGVKQPENMDEYVKSTLELIEECGHSITMVADNPPFAYTTGLCTRAQHPYELAVSCADPDTVRLLMNLVPETLVERSQQPVDGLILEGVIADGYNLKLRRVLDTERFNALRMIYGESPVVWQVLWPSVDNRFPGDADYECEYPQELL